MRIAWKREGMLVTAFLGIVEQLECGGNRYLFVLKCLTKITGRNSKRTQEILYLHISYQLPEASLAASLSCLRYSILLITLF
jgi:hypothetical protein